MSAATPVRWREARLVRAKAEVRAAIEAATAGQEPARRLAYILGEVAALAGDLTPTGQLRRVLFVISALVHHQRHGGLSARDVRSLAELGHSLLVVSGVTPRRSKAAVLYGELGLVLSQILRSERRHWRAAFDYCLAGALAGPELPGGESFFRVGYADRLLRLGDAVTAAAAFAAAETADGPPARRDKARLGRIRCARLAGQPAAAAALLADPTWTFSSDEARREAAWEELRLAFHASGNVHPLVAAVRRGQEHHEPGYALEAWLLVRAVRADEPVHGLPTIRYMGRRKSGLSLAHLAEAYRIAAAIERAYDPLEPLPIRLRRLGEALDEAPAVHSVEVELLVWAAAARCFAALGQEDCVGLAAARYRALSLALTGGVSADALALRRAASPARRSSDPASETAPPAHAWAFPA